MATAAATVTNVVAIFAHQCVFVRDPDTQNMLFKLGYGATRSQQEPRKAADGSAPPTSLLLLDEEALYLTIKQQITVYQPAPPDLSSTGLSYSIDYDQLFSQPTPPNHLSADDLYTLFFTKHRNFPLKFKVYAYFRDQGCCVHTAVNYGLDYAIYQTLPALCHSALSVLVIDGVQGSAAAGGGGGQRGRDEDDDEDEDEGGKTETLRWTHMSAMTRVMGDVSKLLLLCHVVRADSQLYDNSHPYFNEGFDALTPATDEDINFEALACLDSLSVRPVTAVVRRHPANNSDQYSTVQGMQQSFAANLKNIRVRGNKGTKGPNGPQSNSVTSGSSRNSGSGGDSGSSSGRQQPAHAPLDNAEGEKNKGSGSKNKRKRKILENDSGQDKTREKEAKVSRHAKHWKSLYAAPATEPQPQPQPQSSDRRVGGSYSTSDAEDEEGEEGEGGIFGWLGSLFSASEY